ncbi:MAG: TIGR04211 family SH3 domain-containing protein [Gammaproteobacteria bacterium]|nr:TIGR04211 family SH3 domain-containing protein [Gammaproteobacteria bacterium]
MFDKQIFSLRTLVSSVLVMLAVMISMPAQAKTSYVSDELQVPMRSGASNGHRIVKFLKSGTALTVLGASDDDKFIEVEIAGGKSGWIASKDVMSVPSGRDRLAAASKKFANSGQQIKDLKNSIAELKAEIRKLKKERGVLQSESTNLSNSLDDLKITASNPLALSKKNKQLKKELSKAEANVKMLDADNQQLRSNVAQEWFIIGGAVSLGSLIIGLILTRINWKRKKDSWGDSF